MIADSSIVSLITLYCITDLYIPTTYCTDEDKDGNKNNKGSEGNDQDATSLSSSVLHGEKEWCFEVICNA